MASPGCQPGVPYALGPNHPPIVVQTVYVDTSENPDEKEDKKKKPKTSKSKRKGRKSRKESLRPSFGSRRPRRRQRLAVFYPGESFDPLSVFDPYDDMRMPTFCDNDYYDFDY